MIGAGGAGDGGGGGDAGDVVAAEADGVTGVGGGVEDRGPGVGKRDTAPPCVSVGGITAGMPMIVFCGTRCTSLPVPARCALIACSRCRSGDGFCSSPGVGGAGPVGGRFGSSATTHCISAAHHGVGSDSR
jgi:hypothetical protein